MTTQSDRLMKARCRLMVRQPWYGHFAMNMVWIPSNMEWLEEPRRTMGVRIVNGGDIQCLYYPPFVDNLNIKELYAIIQHEIEHVVRLHCLRVGDRDSMLWNIACDMTVNGLKSNPRIGYDEPATKELVIPMRDNIVWIPSSWPSNATAEIYYDMLSKADETVRQLLGEGDGYGFDNHDLWNQSDISHDEARQLVQDVVKQVTEKCQGHAPAHLQAAIKELSKPIVRWREMLKYYLGKHVGNQRKTYSRRNRRRDWFGMPGISHHAAANINVIVDTSGSISDKELEQFFSEIEAISFKAKTMVLQWDSAFHGFDKYRRGDWRRFNIKGRGGTDMAAPMQWLMDNKKIADVQIMLTDGECNYCSKNQINFPVITVITTPEGHGMAPEYGNVVRLRLD